MWGMLVNIRTKSLEIFKLQQFKFACNIIRCRRIIGILNIFNANQNINVSIAAAAAAYAYIANLVYIDCLGRCV